jgi:hypothetical protein
MLLRKTFNSRLLTTYGCFAYTYPSPPPDSLFREYRDGGREQGCLKEGRARIAKGVGERAQELLVRFRVGVEVGEC